MGQAEDLDAGLVVYIQGSGKKPYALKNVGGVFSCDCPAWRNFGGPIDRRTCKHLQKVRGVKAEADRLNEGDLEKILRGATTGGPSARETKEILAAETELEETGKESGPPLLLANKWEGEDPTGYWMSEKLNGVRAYWDGQKFVSKLGNTFFAPSWFTEGLPSETLDGELWLRRGPGALPEVVSIVRSVGAGDRWKPLRYKVFDAPNVAGPFEKRFEALNALVENAKYAERHAHMICRDLAHLKAELAAVDAFEGEGLMLRKPGSAYDVGRSDTLLKVKTFHDDEGKVIGYKPGKGRHKGRLGALIVLLPNGETVDIGTGLSDEVRGNPPAIGSIVTYSYTELTTKGIPLCCSYVGIWSGL